MSDWPVIQHPDDDPFAGFPGRIANMILPISIPGRHQAKIHMRMTETDARALANMSDDLAHEMGPVFELIKSSLNEFIVKEG
jgi:hypothetical protein